jgi:hypothetical protein
MLDSPLGGVSKENLLFSLTANETTLQKLKNPKT